MTLFKRKPRKNRNKHRNFEAIEMFETCKGGGPHKNNYEKRTKQKPEYWENENWD